MTSTLAPFLYQTRTLQRLTRSPATIHGLRLFSTSRPRQTPRRDADPIPFELPPELESESPDRIEETEDAGPDGTITPAERQTFQRIFEEIAERSPRPSRALPRSPTGQRSARKGESAISIIIRDAANKVAGRSAGSGGFDQLSSLEDAYSASAREEAFMKFPPSLRQAARQALGVSRQQYEVDQANGSHQSREAGTADSQPSDMDPESFPIEEEITIEALAERRHIAAQRKAEKARVERLMKGAKTDFELWDVLEGEVFPMVEKLGIGRIDMDKHVPSGKRNGQKRQAKGNKVAVPGVKSPTAALSMEIHGPLYPDFLLQALELFDQRFNSTSRLSFSILPRVKELGLASYVLGINVPFYNSLMKIYWERYGDANAVLSLLEEMRHAGVFFDETTYNIVDSIRHFQSASAKGSKGQWRQALMTMPEFEPVVEMKAKYWSNVIRKSNARRENALAA